MGLKVIISPTGEAATVSGTHHTTQMVGIEDAEKWVRFYERLAAGKSGRFYTQKLAAFREALQGMRDRQAQVRDG